MKDKTPEQMISAERKSIRENIDRWKHHYAKDAPWIVQC